MSALTLWPERPDSPSFSLVLNLSKALISMLTARMLFENHCIQRLSLGSPYDHSRSLSLPHFDQSSFTCPRWSYGANVAQIDADIKVLSEFLSVLQSDSVRGPPPISSLSPARITSACEGCVVCIVNSVVDVILSVYAERMSNLNLPLRLLIENEVFHLSVWGNPTNDARKTPDLIGSTERTLVDVSIIFGL